MLHAGPVGDVIEQRFNYIHLCAEQVVRGLVEQTAGLFFNSLFLYWLRNDWVIPGTRAVAGYDPS